MLREPHAFQCGSGCSSILLAAKPDANAMKIGGVTVWLAQ